MVRCENHRGVDRDSQGEWCPQGPDKKPANTAAFVPLQSNLYSKMMALFLVHKFGQLDT